FLDSTRAGGATVVSAYSPRARPGVPVSFPVPWADLDRVTPADFTVLTAARLLAGGPPWAGQMPAPQRLPQDLIEEGRAIPPARPPGRPPRARPRGPPPPPRPPPPSRRRLTPPAAPGRSPPGQRATSPR